MKINEIAEIMGKTKEEVKVMLESTDRILIDLNEGTKW